MKPSIVSTMMPAYNAKQYIGQAIESVLAQSYPYWELIVVNDGSTDGTEKKVAVFDDPRINLIHQDNAGEAAARNKVLAHVTGDYIAFLDADDVFLPNHLQATVDYLLAHPEYGGVYTDGYYIDQNGNQLQTLSSRRSGPFVGRMFEEVVRSSNVFGPPVCVILQRDIIEQHNLMFDENIIIGPDWDFFAQYAEVAQFGYVDRKTCLYRVHTTNISTRVGQKRRALELAKCRQKAIKMKNFNNCSLEIREWVFYDLLVNLLRGHPERQAAITQWPEFLALPEVSQSRLFRLMASQTLVYENETYSVQDWFRRSRELNPSDRRGALISTVYQISPQLCKQFLILRQRNQPDPLSIPPFADLKRVEL